MLKLSTVSKKLHCKWEASNCKQKSCIRTKVVLLHACTAGYSDCSCQGPTGPLRGAACGHYAEPLVWKWSSYARWTHGQVRYCCGKSSKPSWPNAPKGRQQKGETGPGTHMKTADFCRNRFLPFAVSLWRAPTLGQLGFEQRVQHRASQRVSLSRVQHCIIRSEAPSKQRNASQKIGNFREQTPKIKVFIRTSFSEESLLNS